MDLYTRIALKTEFPYIVSIQNKETNQYSHSVGILIQSQLVLASCNLFFASVNTPPDIEVEEGRFKLFRLIASDTVLVEELQDENAAKAQVRFIENVYLHPECNESNVEVENFRVWRYDVAIIHLSFAFHLDSETPKLGVINFKSETGDLAEDRLQRLTEFQEASNSTVCIVVGWGRFVSIFPADSGIFDTVSRDYPPSHDLLVSTVHLSPFSVCEKYCSENPMLCNLNKEGNGNLVCAERTEKPFISGGKNFSHFPCMGTEGSPLICYGSDHKPDFYGILNYLPKASCENRWPLVFTRIDDVSDFVVSIIGKGLNLCGNVNRILSLITIICFLVD